MPKVTKKKAAKKVVKKSKAKKAKTSTKKKAAAKPKAKKKKAAKKKPKAKPAKAAVVVEETPKLPAGELSFDDATDEELKAEETLADITDDETINF